MTNEQLDSGPGRVLRAAAGRSLFAVALACGLGLASQQAEAVPIIYSDEAAFLADAAASGIGLASEGFESLATGPAQGPVDLGAVSVDNAAGSLLVTATPGQFSEGSRAINVFGSEFPILFKFHGPAKAVGLDIVDAFDIGATKLFLAINDLALMEVLSSQSLLPNGNVQFLGIIDRERPIRTLAFTQDDLEDGVSFDRLQFGGAAYAVAEPASLVLFLTALAGLGFLARRRRGGSP